jgi:hypothetical protein
MKINSVLTSYSSTGYNLYLNEKIRQYKGPPFPEVKYFKIQGLLTRGICATT